MSIIIIKWKFAPFVGKTGVGENGVGENGVGEPGHSRSASGQFLHYNEANDVTYCHTSLVIFKRKMSKYNADPAFVREC